MCDFFRKILVNNSFMGLFCQVVPITCFVGIVYVIIRCVQIKKKGMGFSWSREISRTLFVCYLTGLINLVLVPRNLWLMIWFYLFNGYSGGEIGSLFTFEFNLASTLLKWLIGELTIGRWVLKMFAGNLLMFVPMGFFLPLVSEKVNKRNILKIAVAIPIVIEVIQPIVGRSFDVDDLLLNFTGIIIGYFVAVGVKTLAIKHR